MEICRCASIKDRRFNWALRTSSLWQSPSDDLAAVAWSLARLDSINFRFGPQFVQPPRMRGTGAAGFLLCRDLHALLVHGHLHTGSHASVSGVSAHAELHQSLVMVSTLLVQGPTATACVAPSSAAASSPTTDAGAADSFGGASGMGDGPGCSQKGVSGHSQ